MSEFISTIKNHRLQKNVTEQISKELEKLEGKRVMIKITRLGATRSIRQNSYLHALFNILSSSMIDYTGDEMYTPAKVKNMMKTEFLTREVVSEKSGLVTGKEVLRTRDLNKEDFSTFIEQIIRHNAKEHNIILPYPNEELEIEYEDRIDTPSPPGSHRENNR